MNISKYISSNLELFLIISLIDDELWIWGGSADNASQQENGSGSAVFFDIGAAPLEFADFGFVDVAVVLHLLLLLLLLFLPSLHSCFFHFRHHFQLSLGNLMRERERERARWCVCLLPGKCTCPFIDFILPLLLWFAH